MNLENTVKITMTEAVFLLNDSEQRKNKELQSMGGSSRGGPMGLMMNMNDDVVKKTRQYLDTFVQFKKHDCI